MPICGEGVSGGFRSFSRDEQGNATVQNGMALVKVY